MCDLRGRTALVTGAASGIGAATAIAFARAGADVALGWLPSDPHDVGRVKDAVEAAGRRAFVHEVDVASTESVDTFVATTFQTFGRIDICLANAGIARIVPTLELTDEAWDAVVNVDLLGVWRCFRAVLPHMLDAGYGRLLATSSVAGTSTAWVQHANYSAAKAGLVGLVKTLAVEFGNRGVTANAVAPGVIETPQSLDPVNSMGAEGVAAAARTIPVGRAGKPEDVAALFLFLASEDAGFLTGQLITIDGGRSLLVKD